MEDKTKEYAENTITYFRKNYIPENTEINYKLIDDNTVKFKIPKDHFNHMTAELEKDEFDFYINPAERKMELKFPRHNGTRLLKTKNFDFEVYFVDAAALKTVESIQDKTELNIKNWSDFFERIDPEYRNLLMKIVNGIPIATHKNEYNKVISKKMYWIDPQNGLFEKKEKLINEEWRITYQPVTTNLYQIFRMFFKYFEEPTMNELANFDLFKDIVSNTKYKTYL